MHHAHVPVALILLVIGGCIASNSSLEDGGQRPDGTSESGPAPTTAVATSLDDATSEAHDVPAMRLDIEGGSAECESAELDGCYAASEEACREDIDWNLDEACVAGVVACFPMGTDQLAATDIISLCRAEIEEDCYFGASPGCGPLFCACTVGSGPYDWSNCWVLTTMACVFGVASDCEAVLQSCYPQSTVAEFEFCHMQLIQSDSKYECHCPTCGFQEQCEAEFAACLGA